MGKLSGHCEISRISVKFEKEILFGLNDNCRIFVK